MSCLRMRTCCFCMDTAKGTCLTAIASTIVSIITFIFIVLGLVYWDEFSARIRDSYKDVGLGDDVIDFCIKIVWWGNIFTLFVIILYIVLCVLMVIGVRREQYKHMIPWISVTCTVLPFFAVSFFIQLIFGIIGGSAPVLVPAILVLIWCAFWLYGFFCAVSHYRMLKGDIHRPVATIFKHRL